MFDLPNISVFEFYQLDAEEALKYLELQQYLKPRNLFCGRVAQPIGTFTFGQVAEFKTVFTNATYQGILELFKTVYRVTESGYLNAPIVDYLYATKYLRAEIATVDERENNALSTDPDPDLVMAGINRLKPFGDLITLISLAEKFGKTLEEIENWKYNTVFSILLYNKVYGEIQREYRQIKISNGTK